jgi:hypothetical protein
MQGYTREQIDYLGLKTFGIMFGVCARHAYPKMGEVKYTNGNTRMIQYAKSSVRVGTEVEIITPA